ncbi:MAG: 30S ribosome-binding factor RbfA [Acidimicrobiia bacterium]
MSPSRRYPRVARVNEVLRQVIAETLVERIDDDPRLELVTITGIDCDADLRRAVVYFDSPDREGVDEALQDQRKRLQGAIGSQTKLRRTPQLEFRRDQGVVHGRRIEEIIRGLHDDES